MLVMIIMTSSSPLYKLTGIILSWEKEKRKGTERPKKRQGKWKSQEDGEDTYQWKSQPREPACNQQSFVMVAVQYYLQGKWLSWKSFDKWKSNESQSQVKRKIEEEFQVRGFLWIQLLGCSSRLDTLPFPVHCLHW